VAVVAAVAAVSLRYVDRLDWRLWVERSSSVVLSPFVS